jgi:hypothetical protein
MSLANKPRANKPQSEGEPHRVSLANKSESKIFERIENMSNVITRADGLELAYCEACGNYVPTVEDEGDLFCAYEYAEYPDIATIVG